MIDWLRRGTADPVIDLGAATLPVAIKRHPRAKRLTLRLAPDGSEVRVTMPRWCAAQEGLRFAESRADWLAAQLAKVPQEEVIADGTRMPLGDADLVVAWDSARPRKPVREGNVLHVGGPEDGLHGRVLRWLEAEAMRLFTSDLEHYAAKADLPLPTLALSRARKRWGSCSGKACIRLNWRLVMAPAEVRRSVVAHEVAHLLHFDHSPAFHAALARIFDGDLPAADKWLKQSGRSLYRFG
ncbi:M48 family metallopeptidase [Paraurantiacibacter namhicola]|uniref:YgjP-like metallopeptidase domain-containing protein n=1 Tax=Paraurantiacibacter namhicola TaxID=645517 RepID=A0A1C7D6U0_9SPHN|nr:SprT family zinc-dependent metalloprotease [Paraurantiacibacter namhicola]ANU07175.1 hypothetical protein A6F65_00858 [Paraurantiacibacter namhicola]